MKLYTAKTLEECLATASEEREKRNIFKKSYYFC